MSRIPFTVYDFFAYLSSGSVVVATVDFLYGPQWLLADTIGPVTALFVLFLAYITGHVVAHFSSMLLENGFVAKLLGRPAKALMGESSRKSLPKLFWLYFTPLPEATRQRIRENAASRSFSGSGEALFLHAHSIVTRDKAAQARLDEFRNLYGFCRNMALSFFAAAPLLAVGTGSASNPPTYWWSANLRNTRRRDALPLPKILPPVLLPTLRHLRGTPHFGEHTMKFTVYDVGHGMCLYFIADNGNVILFDCGHKSDPENRPSKFLPARKCTAIEKLVITNYDEDHISDLPNLRAVLPIDILVRNKSTSPEQLRALKLEASPISPAMASLLDMLGTYTSPITNEPEYPGLVWNTYWNNYGDFTDTNNLSLVSFLHCKDFHAIIPGDLERPGWKKLLEREAFRNDLRRTTVFIASHHGRENGYCREVFDYCTPSVVVFSDSSIRHATQEMAKTYASHASGITFNGEKRFVLSTRNDGSITWTY